MKQHITKEQWDLETTPEQKYTWNDSMVSPNPSLGSAAYPNIGQMIEFLGDVIKMSKNDTEDGMAWFILGESWRSSGEFELCDALWSACKQKLNI